MNYRHAYHAGNFADVLKHIVLMRCLVHLGRKPAPFRVIDTHAGAGRYRLHQGEAAKTGEWREGIGRLIGPDATPFSTPAEALLAPYFDAIRAENPDGTVSVYPGSPALIRTLLRASDALVANELHPEDVVTLKAVFARDKACQVLQQDGYSALKALLPPKERRGLVLIDPPFEEPGELIRMTDALKEGLARFATGMYLLWYPIKDEKPVARFHKAIGEVALSAKIETPLKIEMMLREARNPLILNGCGLVVVNPPHTLVDDLQTVLPEAVKQLGDMGKSFFRVGPVVASPQPDQPPEMRRVLVTRTAKPPPRTRRKMTEN
jgi:23S rRNA (adenine2030-N6)-methyltransferase